MRIKFCYSSFIALFVLSFINTMALLHNNVNYIIMLNICELWSNFIGLVFNLNLTAKFKIQTDFGLYLALFPFHFYLYYRLIIRKGNIFLKKVYLKL